MSFSYSSGLLTFNVNTDANGYIIGWDGGESAGTTQINFTYVGEDIDEEGASSIANSVLGGETGVFGWSADENSFKLTKTYATEPPTVGDSSKTDPLTWKSNSPYSQVKITFDFSDGTKGSFTVGPFGTLIKDDMKAAIAAYNQSPSNLIKNVNGASATKISAAEIITYTKNVIVEESVSEVQAVGDTANSVQVKSSLLNTSYTKTFSDINANVSDSVVVSAFNELYKLSQQTIDDAFVITKREII